MAGRSWNIVLSEDWRRSLRISAMVGVAAVGALAAVSESKTGLKCVELAEGVYEVQNGLLRPISAPTAATLEQELQRVQDLLPRLGYDWLELHLSDDVLLLRGAVQSGTEREKAFAAGTAMVRSNPILNQSVRVIADQMELVSEDPPDPITEIDPVDADALETCQTDLEAALSSGGVGFNTEGIRLTARGQSVLDEVVDIAKRCERYDLDIAGHAELTGNETFQTVLSSARAEEVRRYLEAEGIGSERLSVIAYGGRMHEAVVATDSRPVDIAFTMP